MQAGTRRSLKGGQVRQSSLFTGALGILLALVSPVQGAWRLIWRDEFNGPPNAPPDPSKWTYDLGNNNGWGNHELEAYTNLLRMPTWTGRAIS